MMRFFCAGETRANILFCSATWFRAASLILIESPPSTILSPESSPTFEQT